MSTSERRPRPGCRSPGALWGLPDKDPGSRGVSSVLWVDASEGTALQPLCPSPSVFAEVVRMPCPGRTLQLCSASSPGYPTG